MDFTERTVIDGKPATVCYLDAARHADNAGQGDDDGGPLRQRRHDVRGGEAESAGPNLTPPG